MGPESAWGKGNLHGSAGTGAGLSSVNWRRMGGGVPRTRRPRIPGACVFVAVNLAVWRSDLAAALLRELSPHRGRPRGGDGVVPREPGAGRVRGEAEGLAVLDRLQTEVRHRHRRACNAKGLYKERSESLH